MLLQDKVAVVTAAAARSVAPSRGRSAARAHAFYLAGRTQATLDAVAASIRAAGGIASHGDRRRARRRRRRCPRRRGRRRGRWPRHLVQPHHPRRRAGHADGRDGRGGLPRAGRRTGVRTTFLTAKAAARHMIPRGGGAILIFGGSGDPPRGYYLGGLQTGFEAMEAMRRQLSVELGPPACASSRCGPAASPRASRSTSRAATRSSRLDRPRCSAAEPLSPTCSTPPCSQPRTTPAR